MARDGTGAVRGLAAVSAASIGSIGITSVISAVMPLALNLSGYAYWQLFSLYLSFAGFAMLGINDGIYQRYARRPFGDAEKRELAGFLPMVLMAGLFSALVVSAGSFWVSADRRFVVLGVAACLVFFGAVGFLTYVQQLAGSLHVVAFATIMERLVLLALTLGLVMGRCKDYRYYVVACVLASLVKLAFLGWRSARVLRTALRTEARGPAEIWAVARQGFPIMLSILLSGSIVVPSRLVVEHQFGPEMFALFSFALTVVFVTGSILGSVSQAAFPLLARVSADEQVAVVRRAHSTLVVMGAALLFCYFAAAVLISQLYPAYAPSLKFLAFLFPLLVFQNKYVLLLCNVMRSREQLWRMVIVAGSGMLVNFLAALAAAKWARSVVAVSLVVLVGYAVWQSVWWRSELGSRGPFMHSWDLVELGMVLVFLACVVAPQWFHTGRWAPFVSAAGYLAVVLAAGLAGRRHVTAAVVPLARRFARSPRWSVHATEA